MLMPVPRQTASPVAFHLQKLNSIERNYEIDDKELIAIMEAFKEWK